MREEIKERLQEVKEILESSNDEKLIMMSLIIESLEIVYECDDCFGELIDDIDAAMVVFAARKNGTIILPPITKN